MHNRDKKLIDSRDFKDVLNGFHTLGTSDYTEPLPRLKHLCI